MNRLTVPVDAKSLDWPRRVANAINGLLARRSTPFDRLDTEPADPVAGQTYFDTGTGKVRTWDGAAWQDHY